MGGMRLEGGRRIERGGGRGRGIGIGRQGEEGMGNHLRGIREVYLQDLGL